MAYKGMYSLLLANETRDWMEDKALDMVHYASLGTDIHHIFPQHWCDANHIDDERRESIVNKTAISAHTNRTIGGSAPPKYLAAIEAKAHIPSAQLDGLLDGHLVSASTLQADDFDAFFVDRRERLCQLIEKAIGKAGERDVNEGHPTGASEEFEPEVEDPEGSSSWRSDLKPPQYAVPGQFVFSEGQLTSPAIGDRRDPTPNGDERCRWQALVAGPVPEAVTGCHPAGGDVMAASPKEQPRRPC